MPSPWLETSGVQEGSRQTVVREQVSVLAAVLRSWRSAVPHCLPTVGPRGRAGAPGLLRGAFFSARFSFTFSKDGVSAVAAASLKRLEAGKWGISLRVVRLDPTSRGLLYFVLIAGMSEHTGREADSVAGGESKARNVLESEGALDSASARGRVRSAAGPGA